ncbi:MAG: tetratricopeptide repeat protein [Deltaproteobacteria bacterium]|nr:tetratricopeptide repeat protein [Deltaproteobacteria bacterium]
MTVRGFLGIMVSVAASILLALPVAAGDKGGDDKGGEKEIKTYKMPEAQPVQKIEGRKNAPMGVKSLAHRPRAMAEDKLDQAIKALDELIDMTAEDDPSKPEFLSRKAELYWDKAENYFNKAYGNEMFKKLKDAQDSGDETLLAAVKAEQQGYLDARKKWQNETVKVYEKIVDDYPGYPGLDAVLYYLGFTLVQMDRSTDAFPFFSRIIRETPTSQYAPDALLNIGEFYFNSGRMDDAAKIYTEVENFPMSAAYGLAIYKKGWCLYNMGQHEAAMSQFLRVIDYARSDAAKAVGYGKQLLREAQRDLVMVYSQVGSPENAIKVFRKITPDGYMELAIRLAEGYGSQGEYVKSIRLFKKIIAEYAKRKDAYRVIEFQRKILTNAYRLGIAARVVEEARRLIGLLDKFKDTAPPEFIKPEMAKAEQMIRIIVTTYHKEVAVTHEQRTQEFTLMLYGEYLRLFPNASERYNMILNYAQLLEDMHRYADAAVQYNRLVALRPNGKHAIEAARSAVRNYAEMRNQAPVVKSEDTADLEPNELPEFEKKLVAACDRYLKMAKPDAPEVVQARFLAGIVLYQHNHFPEAITYFRSIIKDHPNHDNAPDAARLLLSSLHLKRDIKGLNAAAEEISRNPSLMKGDVPMIVNRIREQADFNKCYEFEQQKKHRTAAECFLEYVRAFPNTPLKDRSLINAANNFFKARLVERSLQANTQLFNDMPESPLAPQALYNVGEIYRRLAVYSEAARFYEIFVKMLPKHKLTEEALRYATVFRSGLGEYAAAIKDLKKYLSLFKDSKHAASVAFEIGVAREKQGKYRAALKYFQNYIKKFGKGAGLDLYLKAHLKVAQMYKARKDRKRTLKWYAETVKAYEDLTEEEKGKLTSVGLGAVAEARFMQGEAILTQVRAVRLRLPEKVLTKAISKKLGLIKSAMEVFHGVEAFGQPHWTIAALSRKGFGFQDLAESIENAPIPRKLNAEQKAMFREGLGPSRSGRRPRPNSSAACRWPRS